MKKFVKRLFSKGAVKSKTMIFAGALGTLTWLQNHIAVVDAFTPDLWEESAGYAIALAVSILRVVTDKPLDEK